MQPTTPTPDRLVLFGVWSPGIIVSVGSTAEHAENLARSNARDVALDARSQGEDYDDAYRQAIADQVPFRLEVSTAGPVPRGLVDELLNPHGAAELEIHIRQAIGRGAEQPRVAVWVITDGDSCMAIARTPAEAWALCDVQAADDAEKGYDQPTPEERRAAGIAHWRACGRAICVSGEDFEALDRALGVMFDMVGPRKFLADLEAMFAAPAAVAAK